MPISRTTQSSRLDDPNLRVSQALIERVDLDNPGDAVIREHDASSSGEVNLPTLYNGIRC